MAELEFYFSIKERDIFFEYCFQKGCFLVPSIDYKDEEYFIVKNNNDLVKYRGTVQFFILHESFFICPLRFRSFARDTDKYYYICQQYGGPAIDFAASIFSEMKNNRIAGGSIHFYPFYYVGKQKIYPSDGLKEFYKEFVKFIKKMCSPVKVNGRIYWIGNETIELAKQGKVGIVGPYDLSKNEVDMLALAMKAQERKQKK